MSWDVPTELECPQCGQTMFKKSGRGRQKAFCINEQCSNFLPEDQRGYYKKKMENAEEAPVKEEKKAADKTAKKNTRKKKEAGA